MGASLPIDKGSAGKLLQLTVGDKVPEWVQSVGEREAGVASVSAPVCDGEGRVLAAVSVSGPMERTSRKPGVRYAADVIAAARRIERAAGLR